MNPNIIPHPAQKDVYIIVAQQEKSGLNDPVFTELTCNAIFANGQLSCSTSATPLPVEGTQSLSCEGSLVALSLSIGPHDARAFYGPNAPYTVFGSNSGYSCFGQWIQDLRALVDEFGIESMASGPFKTGTEIQRPPPVAPVEKNWFVFWDNEGQMYAHYDISPKRSFARLSADGSVSEDLAPLASSNDDKCMAKYMPKVAESLESIHQATNSLLITMCKRSDRSCRQREDNTFIMTIFQHKSYYSFHSVYEPYVMLFKQSAPFEVHAIAKKPFWIHGRDRFTTKSGAVQWEGLTDLPENQSEMFYVTSMSWGTHGQKYHGFLDDILFVSFGIEDSRSGMIDVLAGDLLQDLGRCADV